MHERSLLGHILEIVRAKDVWIDDRNFCTTGFLFGIARREAFFVVRQHAATLHWEFTGKKRACGRIETGKVFEQTVRLTNPDTGEILFARRITVVLDKPTRDGDGEIHILTNLPKKAARAKTVADLYRSAGPSRPRSKNWRRRSMARSTRWATPRRRCSLSAWRWCRTT